MTTIKKKIKFVKVLWLDTEDFKDVWISNNDEVDLFLKADEIIESRGFLIGESKKYIGLARDYCKSKEIFGGLEKIPKNIIIKIINQ